MPLRRSTFGTSLRFRAPDAEAGTDEETAIARTLSVSRAPAENARPRSQAGARPLRTGTTTSHAATLRLMAVEKLDEDAAERAQAAPAASNEAGDDGQHSDSGSDVASSWSAGSSEGTGPYVAPGPAQLLEDA